MARHGGAARSAGDRGDGDAEVMLCYGIRDATSLHLGSLGVAPEQAPSRATFIELMPSSATRPPGFTHFGIHVDDVHAGAARLEERGIQAGQPRTIGSGSLTVSITDPDGNRFEVSELPADSPVRKAMHDWK